jgi:hypothetical protein
MHIVLHVPAPVRASRRFCIRVNIYVGLANLTRDSSLDCVHLSTSCPCDSAMHRRGVRHESIDNFDSIHRAKRANKNLYLDEIKLVPVALSEMSICQKYMAHIEH